MNFYNILLFVLTGVTCFQQKQFVKVVKDQVSIKRQDEIINITVPFQIQDGYHIQALSDTQDNLIPTEITFETPDGCHILKQEFSKTHCDMVVLNKITHKVLSKSLVVMLTLKCQGNMSPDNLELKGRLYYQTCNDTQCFFPRTLKFSVGL